VPLQGTVPQPRTDLAIRKFGIKQGELITYTITVANVGNSAARSVITVDQIPNAVQFVSAQASVGRCVQFARFVVCNHGNLASQGSVEITVTTRLRPGIQQLRVRNIAAVWSATQELNRASNVAVAIVRLR
jgi:uncharacterized repeat protein (TIGR01451 family)